MKDKTNYLQMGRTSLSIKIGDQSQAKNNVKSPFMKKVEKVQRVVCCAKKSNQKTVDFNWRFAKYPVEF